MQDGGFVNGHARKFQAMAALAQSGGDYRAALVEAVAEAVAQAEVWQPGSKNSLLKGLAGHLEFLATTCETPEPLLPEKLTDSELNILVRAKALKEAAGMLLAACQ